MSVEAPILPQAKVIEQVKGLHEQKNQLQTHLTQIEDKLRMIEMSLSENDNLKKKVKELLAASHAHFMEEWKRRIEFYPDIRLASLQKLIEINAPAVKK